MPHRRLKWWRRRPKPVIYHDIDFHEEKVHATAAFTKKVASSARREPQRFCNSRHHSREYPILATTPKMMKTPITIIMPPTQLSSITCTRSGHASVHDV